MRSKPVEECIGSVLCQDLTQIIPGGFKGAIFKKGHVVTKEDIPVLLSIGKENLYVWEPAPDEVHENDAAQRLAEATAGAHIRYDEPAEGKITLFAEKRGLFTVDSETFADMNMIDYVTMASLPSYFTVEAGAKLAGVRVVPLLVPEKSLTEVEKIAAQHPQKVFNVHPYHKLQCGIITTGSEVYKGRIKDKFGPVMRDKIAYYGGECLGQTFCLDDQEMIGRAIAAFVEQGADLIILTGGMSVDPDDVTPTAIAASGANVISYGAPVQPGNMLMLAYLGKTTLVGVPGCAMYFRTTALDTVLARTFAGISVSKRDLARMGEGGLCNNCKECHYPVCYFCR